MNEQLVDSTNPDAREFLWKRLNESYFSKGIHNFWIDQADGTSLPPLQSSVLANFARASGGSLGEFYVNNGQDPLNLLPYPRPFTQYFLGTQEGTGKMYPWLHQQAIEEGFNNLTSSSGSSSSLVPSANNGVRTSCEHMSLTRSTFVGGQRFCSYLWSGDTDSRFDVLLQQITTGVSVAASGISSWTLDIGGFAGLNIDTDEVNVLACSLVG
jgi:alpha-glucosidase (family GH31 glycosyl hydrolase)